MLEWAGNSNGPSRIRAVLVTFAVLVFGTMARGVGWIQLICLKPYNQNVGFPYNPHDVKPCD